MFVAKALDHRQEREERKVAQRYNGYSWDGVNRVYVPYSTLIFLDQQCFANHWFATGTPTFLIKLLRQNQVPADELERISADSTLMERADVDNISVLALLFQTGYLTVKQVHDEITGVLYDLGYPNYEVAQSMRLLPTAALPRGAQVG